MTIDAGTVQWLKSEGLLAYFDDAANAEAYGALAIDTDILSPLADGGAAEAEAERQLAVLRGPNAVDLVRVAGLRRDLHGQPVRLVGGRLGYDAAPVCFVLGYEEREATDETVLTVLRPL